MNDTNTGDSPQMHIPGRSVPAWNFAIGIVFIGANILMIVLARWEQLRYELGLAWDSGLYYRMMSLGVPKIFQHNVSGYHIQRILPGLIVDAGIKLFHIPGTRENVILGFTCLDWLCVNVSAIYICRILRLLKQDNKTILIGLTLFLFNFFLVKLALYMPISTDLLSLLLGTMMLHAYFSRKGVWLLILTLASAFTHPVMLIFGGLLYCFPYSETTNKLPAFRKLNRYDFFLIGAVMAGVLALYLRFYNTITGQVMYFGNEPTPVLKAAYPMSLLLVLVYIGVFAIFFMKAGIFRLVIAAVKWKRALVFVLFAGACKFLQYTLANGEQDQLSAIKFGLNLVRQSITFPLGFLVAHVNFFGPCILLVALNFKSFMLNNLRLGAGFLLSILMCSFFFLGAESRQYGFLFPLLIISISMVMGSMRIKTWILAILLLTGMAMTRFWYQLNVAPFVGSPRSFPDQRLFMNLGPWMTLPSYLTLLCIAVGAAMISGLCLFRLQNGKIASRNS